MGTPDVGIAIAAGQADHGVLEDPDRLQETGEALRTLARQLARRTPEDEESRRQRAPTGTPPSGPVTATGDMLLPSGPDGYAQMLGTSWACAIVSGIVALLLQVDPTLKQATIRKLLTDTAHPTRSDKAGARVVDAYRAVRAALQPSSQAGQPVVRKRAARSRGVRKVTARRATARR